MTVKNTSLTMNNLDLHSLIRDMPGFVIIKDLQSNYLNGNLNTVHEFGLKNSDLLLGYSDLTIPHPLSHNGQLYRNLDREVILTGEPMKGICTFPFQGSIRPYQFRKSLLKDINGNNIATYSHAEECTDAILVRIIHYLIRDYPLENTNNNFILNKAYRGLKLLPLESSCLFYLIRKKTITEIAGLLNLHVNIINLYVDNIKNQLKVNTISDVFDIAIEKEYINIVPPAIFTQLYQSNSGTKLLQNNISLDNRVNFTNRELDCIKLLMNGCKIKEIAAAINLSPRTVETHINNLKMKLDCRDKVELIIKLREMVL